MIVDSWLVRAAELRPRNSAIETTQRTLTYEQLLPAAQAGAAALAARGVRPLDEVAIALPPGAEFAIALHACWLAGAVAVPLDLRHLPSEREAATKGAKAIVAAPLPDTATACKLKIPFTHDLDAVALVVHTSGTTSQPRRVQLTFGNLLWSALGSAVALGCDDEERWLSTLPLCHVGGLSILVRSAIAATTAVVHPRFDTQAALTALVEQRITVISVVATTLARLLDAGLKDPPCLRVALAGGGPVPQALLARAAQAGVRVSQTYGLTESCSQASTVPVAAIDGRALASAAPRGVNGAPRSVNGAPCPLGSAVAALGAGKPLFCTSLEIADDGEILLSGPTIAASALAHDGSLHTGDLGALDGSGNLHVSGRKSDTIISGGENVAPAEVEAVLEAHPSVAEAAVIGRSDPTWGEAVTAIVVLRDGAADLDGHERDIEAHQRELIAHCAQRLAPYKVPKRVIAVSGPLPRTSSGKLLRRELLHTSP